jgi:hypothetical protein
MSWRKIGQIALDILFTASLLAAAAWCIWAWTTHP